MGIHFLVVDNVICSAKSLLRNLTKGMRSEAFVGLGTAFSLDVLPLIFIGEKQNYRSIRPWGSWRLLRARWRSISCLWTVQQFINSPNEIDVMGRTGAGKYSLTFSLSRLVEPAEGAIVIDGVCIADIGLHDIREKLAIILQDPFLFTGPLTMNLDPEDLYTDEDIWAALDHTHLRSFVESLSDGLETDCGEGGSNFRILVLDEGEVKEFDSPEKLLQTKGVFYQMARDAGV